MKFLKLIVFFTLFIGLLATQTFVSTNGDPYPSGGADCTENSDCNYPKGGTCEIDNQTLQNGNCVCYNDYADPDCTYERKSKGLAAGLEWLLLVGAGGVGNFYIEKNGEGVGQLILCLPFVFFPCFLCGMCCGKCEIKCQGVGGIICLVITLAMMLAGFIWSMVTFGMILDDKVTDGNGYALS